MNWQQQWINEILADVPAGEYRSRVEAELRDHLESHRLALAEAGWSQNEAQAEALRTMGEPEALRKEYLAAWRRTPERRASALGGIAAGCLVMGMSYIYTFMLLGMAGFTYDATIPGRVCFQILSSNMIYVTVFSTVLFLLPFTLGALFLRFVFRKESRPAGLVTTGLLTAWAGEKVAIILISALIYEMPLDLDLLTRIYHGGDPTAPWLSPVYYVLTFLGCILLGLTIGQFPIKRGKSTAA